MKKFIAIAIVGMFGVVSLGSCKKDYTCECTVTNGTVSATSTSTINGTKKDAKAACEKNNQAYATCKIK